MAETSKAEDQLLTAERVVGHARVDGINNANIYYAASVVLALRGEKQLAMQSLLQAYEKGFRTHWLLESDERLEILWDEPEFSAILELITNDIASAQLDVLRLNSG